jgi:hypothetical protein
VNKRARLASLCASVFAFAGCKDNLDVGYNGRAIASVDSAVLVAQDGPATTVPLRLSGYTDQDGVSLSCTHNAGSGVTVVCEMDPGSAASGTLTLRADANSQPGAYGVVVTASVSPSAGSDAPAAIQSVGFTVAVGVTVSPQIDTTSGQGGRLDEFMATAFQPADWQSDFFVLHPDTSSLQALAPRHILIQVMNGGAIPLLPPQSSQGAPSWDFTELDDIVQPVLAVSALNPAPDSGPELQIAVAPNVAGMTDPTTGLVESDAFATYAACLVGYYNKGFFQDPYSFQIITNPRGATPIHWWGIWSDYNVGATPLSTPQYTQLYIAASRAMLAVDGTIALSAPEFNDFPGNGGDPKQEIPTFANGLAAAAPVQALSLHLYGTDDPSATDTDVLATIPNLATDISTIYDNLKGTALAGVPVWITQNNVNGDAPGSMGQSTYNRNNPFRDDLRGTSAFFAAWRPYLFSQAGKAGNRGLFHWEYTAGRCGTQATTYCLESLPSSDTDTQNAEVDYATGHKYLSYWVDYELGHMFPSPPGEDILQSVVSESRDVEVLATQQDAGQVVVMVVNKAVVESSADAGAGQPLTVVVDLSALTAGGAFASASTVILDAATATDTGPVAVSRSIGDGRIPVVFATGYGAAFVVLDRAP